jgi:hypothetical protein
MTISQTSSHPSVSFYELPVEIKFKNSVSDTSIVLNHTTNGQVFTIPLNFVPDSAFFDPEKWICSANNTVIGVEENENEFNLKVYPTVTQGIIHIRGNSNPELSLRAEIISVDGKMLDSPIISNSKIDLTSYPEGVYLLKLFIATQHSVFKIIKE